jgi:hypothetical protein
VATYGKVSYKGVYPGVDLVYYGNQRQLEYDFVMAPGADPKQVKLHFSGARDLKLDGEGDLWVVSKNGQIAFHEPVVYQNIDGRRHSIAGKFRLLANNTIGFAVGNYDHARALVIDPTLEYSTYLGGSGSGASGSNEGNAIAVDGSGEAYVTGYTSSVNFPTTAGAPQTSSRGGRYAFVTKLNASGVGLVYSTYLGGGFDAGLGIAVDLSGNAYVTGSTASVNFPVTSGAFQTTGKFGPGPTSNAFVTKLNSTGTLLVYSTYLGSSGTTANAIAVDVFGNAYVTGGTGIGGSDFPVTPGAFQTHVTFGGAFVTKLNPNGTALVYSTYLGDAQADFLLAAAAVGNAIAVDADGNAYVGGWTTSPNFPVTAGAFQTVYKGSIASPTGFVTKMNSTGTALKYSSYLGGSSTQRVLGIAVDETGNAYSTGLTGSLDFPVTPGAFQTTLLSTSAFVTKMNSEGTGLVYSTYFGGADPGGVSFGLGIVVDAAGNAFVVGATTSSQLPVTADAFQAGKKGSPPFFNVFLTELNPTGASLIYSTYIGGSIGNGDHGAAIALDSAENAYLTGYTDSSDFPVTPGAFQTASGAPREVFISKFALGSGSTLTATTTRVSSSANPQNFGVGVTFTATVAPRSGSGIPTGSIAFSVDGTSESSVALDGTGHASYATSTLSAGQHSIATAYSGDTIYLPSGGSLTETILVTSGSAALFGSITGKSGPTNARLWSIQVGNSGPATAAGAQVSSIVLTQVGRLACNPAVTSALPTSAGNLAAGASVTVPVTFDFSTCVGNARFTANIALSANGGTTTASIIRLNQFQ